jgi:hypothetical protein
MIVASDRNYGLVGAPRKPGSDSFGEIVLDKITELFLL